MKPVLLRDVKKGDYFKRSETAKKVYVRGHYVGGTTKRYSVHPFDDVNNEMFLRGDSIVWIDFEF